MTTVSVLSPFLLLMLWLTFQTLLAG